MLIGVHIRAIREAKNLSQGDIEKRCGLLRVYISRVENGHLVPSIETLEKLAGALEVPLYQLFYERKKRPPLPHLPTRKLTAEIMWGTTRKEIYFWEKLRGLLWWQVRCVQGRRSVRCTSQRSKSEIPVKTLCTKCWAQGPARAASLREGKE
jgi:transcriptional regulator with XRE-family HTH domain